MIFVSLIISPSYCLSDSSSVAAWVTPVILCIVRPCFVLVGVAGRSHVPMEKAAFQGWLESVSVTFLTLNDQQRNQSLDHLISLSGAVQLRHLSNGLETLLKRDFLRLLPLELAFYLLRWLDPQTLLTCCSVCKQWNKVNSWDLVVHSLGASYLSYMPPHLVLLCLSPTSPCPRVRFGVQRKSEDREIKEHFYGKTRHPSLSGTSWSEVSGEGSAASLPVSALSVFRLCTNQLKHSLTVLLGFVSDSWKL